MNQIGTSLIVYLVVNLVLSTILGVLCFDDYHSNYCDYFNFIDLVFDTDMNLFGKWISLILIILFANILVILHLVIKFIYWITHI